MRDSRCESGNDKREKERREKGEGILYKLQREIEREREREREESYDEYEGELAYVHTDRGYSQRQHPSQPALVPRVGGKVV
jgi:hypothetical protein